MFLSLQHRDLIDRVEARRGSLLHVHFVLIGVNVIREIPVGIDVLYCQAVGVNSGMNRPGMNFRQRIIFVNEDNAVAVFLEDFGKQCLVHSGAKWTLEVVEIHRDHLGRLGPARRSSRDVDLAHHIGERIFVQIKFCHPQHGAAVLGNQKLVVFLLAIALDLHRYSVIARHVIAGSNGADRDFYIDGDGIESTHLMFDLASDVGGRGLGNTTETNEKKDEQRTPN